MEFNRKNLLELRKLSREELTKYYMEKRKEEDEKGIPLSKKGIMIRNKIHQLLLQIVMIDRLLNHETITVLKDERIKTDRPIIFAVTHVGKYDIEVVSEAIKDHYYLLLIKV